MKLQIHFNTSSNGSNAVRILNRLTHDLDGQRLRPGKRFLLVGDRAEAVGAAVVSSEPKTTSEHAASLMLPVIGYVRENGVKRLMETFQRMTGEAFNYSTWMRWLAADPKRRMEPAIGTAMAIATAYERMLIEDADAERTARVDAALNTSDKLPPK